MIKWDFCGLQTHLVYVACCFHMVSILGEVHLDTRAFKNWYKLQKKVIMNIVFA